MEHPESPVLRLSVKAAAATAARLFVTATGAVAGNGANALGVSYAGGEAGKPMAVTILGAVMVTSGAAVAVGDPVQSDAAGKAIEVAGNGKTLGRALTAVAAANQPVLVHLIPN